MTWSIARFLVAFVLLGSFHNDLSFSLSSSIDEERGADRSNQLSVYSSSSSSCSLYFAPSTIPGGRAGYGMFAGKSFKRKEYVTPGDLVVPLVDLTWHYGYERFADDLWEEYQWSASTFPGMEHEGRQEVAGASFGVGAVPNSYPAMINLEVSSTSMDDYDDKRRLHRSRDPGAGAFTPYHNRTSVATTDIPAGMELFINYGSNYFSGREKDYGLLPTLKDYKQGDQLVSRFLKLREGRVVQQHRQLKHNETDIEEDTSLVNMKQSTPQSARPLATPIQSTVLDLLQSLADVWQSRPLKTLPAKPEHVGYASQHGTSNLHFNRSIRSLDWLEEHGLCMDNIRSGPSTKIPQAGRGAFSTRFIAKGDVVAPMPLIHIPDRNLYRMYDSMPKDEDGQVYRNASAPVHWQLMLNYCFGHRHSSLLLCPYGVLTSTVNHSQRYANTKIVWSQKVSRHYEWLEQPVREWGRTRHAGLAFELIATRDIPLGEEILLDYGDEWEAAWQTHVAAWKPPPPPGSESYVTADELNQRLDVQIRTVAEGSYDPNDKLLFCTDNRGRDQETKPLLPCRAIRRFSNNAGEDRYTVQVSREVIRNDGHVAETQLEIWHDFPREAFFFQDAYYSRDHGHTQTWSFRHDMRIPDEIMPRAWLHRLN